MIRIIPGLILAAALLSPAATAGQQVPPDADWQTLHTENFRVTFAPGLEPLARHVSERAEVAHARLAAELASAPRGTIDIVLGDHVDFAEGAATVFPTNRIYLQAHPPLDEPTISFYRDWMDLVVTHELTHVFHIDHVGSVGRVLRRVFGRPPFGWPFFPGHSGPRWVVEGLATQIESEHSGAGRVHGSIPEMMIRTAILEGSFDGIDRADGFGPAWPAAQRRYIYGSHFLDYLAGRYGDEVNSEIVRVAGRSLLPPSLAFDRVGRKTIDQTFSAAWEDWRRELETAYGQLADSLRAEGVTEGERLTETDYIAWYPRAAQDGRIAFAVTDGRSDAGIRMFDPITNEVTVVSRTNGVAPTSWLPDGRTLLISQLEFAGPYRVYQDLYAVGADRGERRLTRRGRLAQPHVAPDGRSAVAVQKEGGTNRLALYDLETGEVRPITDYRGDTNWALPRWGPQGRRIAAGRWRDGGTYDIAVLDPSGRELLSFAAGPAIAGSPAWSPDGRYLLFWSDRSGIPNLYAFDMEPALTTDSEVGTDQPPLLQVTNVLTGALFPEVSPDARWIYFSGYHANGYTLERIPYDPSNWREPPAAPVSLRVTNGRGGAEPIAYLDDDREPSAGADQVTPYSPWSSLLPRYWLPRYDDRGRAGHFFGLSTSARDPIGRHAYAADLAIDPGNRRFHGRIAYQYAGLGNPVIDVRASRRWRFAGQVRLDDTGSREVLGREDILEIGATTLRRRWRSITSFTVGGDFAADQFVHDPSFRIAKPRTQLAGAFGRVRFSNARRHAFSISPEDGVSLTLGARYRHDLLPDTVTDDGDQAVLDRSYREATAFAAAYKSLPLPGFASHVVAARVSALIRHGPGAINRLADVGGANGTSGDFGVIDLGNDARFLPVRGFAAGDQTGSHAWTASLEYRVPLLVPGRGYRLLPFFIDRLSATAFLDAGHAWCTPHENEASSSCDPAASPLLGAGGEVALDIGLFFGAPLRLRTGLGHPISGHDNSPVAYFRFGTSF